MTDGKVTEMPRVAIGGNQAENSTYRNQTRFIESAYIGPKQTFLPKRGRARLLFYDAEAEKGEAREATNGSRL
jgi:hypothetical protein